MNVAMSGKQVGILCALGDTIEDEERKCVCISVDLKFSWL